jgi:hypothetical protein
MNPDTIHFLLSQLIEFKESNSAIQLSSRILFAESHDPIRVPLRSDSKQVLVREEKSLKSFHPRQFCNHAITFFRETSKAIMTFLWQTEQWWIFSFIAEVSKCRTCIDCDTSHARMRMIIVLVNWYNGATRQEIGVLYDRCLAFHEFE